MKEEIPDNLPYTPPGIECIRFGARRGAAGIGCCAVDIFQGFSRGPSETRPPIPMLQGDSRMPIADYGSGDITAIAGTNEEVFLSYLYHGTMSEDMAQDHAFIAILTGEQLEYSTGKDWLRILKREGFKWVGTTSNSVYGEFHPNHIFMLIRSTGEYMSDEEIMALSSPPTAWLEIEEPEETPEERLQDGLVKPAHIKIPGDSLAAALRASYGLG